MKPTLAIDASQFTTALRAYSKLSSRELSQIINSRMFFVALKTFRRMKPLFRYEQQAIIQSRLQGPPTKVASRSAKNPKAKPLMLANILAQWERRKKGLPGLRGRRMHTATLRFIKRRIGKVGYLKSALASTMRFFSKFAPGGRVPDARRMRGTRDSNKAAQPGWNPVASFALLVGIAADQETKVNAQYAAALQAAFDSETHEMEKETKARMQALSDKFKPR